MATYDELAGLRADPRWGDFTHRVEIAVAIKAQAIADLATPTLEQKTWARDALTDPRVPAEPARNYVVAANASATVDQIFAATDATIQTNVDAAVDDLFGVA